jgi:hypothetical protein
MANGRSGGSRTIGYIIGGIILLLILAWLFGLFGGGDDVAEVEDGTVVTEEGAATGEDAEEAAEEAADD